MKILTYGTFDLFHVGHVRLLQRLRTLGDELIVGLSTDEFNEIKGKKTIMPYQHRLEILSACRYVTKVIPETCWEQKREDVLREKIDLFAMGDDWAGKFDDLEDLCRVLYIPRTKDISTTEIKQFIGLLNQEKKNQTLALLEKASSIIKQS